MPNIVVVVVVVV